MYNIEDRILNIFSSIACFLFSYVSDQNQLLFLDFFSVMKLIEPHV